MSEIGNFTPLHPPLPRPCRAVSTSEGVTEMSGEWAGRTAKKRRNKEKSRDERNNRRDTTVMKEMKGWIGEGEKD